ncbi:cell adhesion molecule DSCAM [Rhipicephalus microplus]|uniref:cell adhesion molecule DSCAM n=1 Tax=Rhipicephalus microplus TaxID=6941 RepID=UPI003F6C499F
MRQHRTTTDIPEGGSRGGVCSSYITAGYNVREFFASAAMMQQGYRTTATLASALVVLQCAAAVSSWSIEDYETPWAKPPRTLRLDGAEPARILKSVPPQQQQLGYVGSPDYWPFAGHTAPSFDPATPRNVTTQLGQTVYLSCMVNNLGDKTVTWIRRKDLHVLTVGLDTYVQDPRFQAIHLERSNDWALQIRYAQLNDQGLYECQVSSDPKMSLFVRLRVLVARAEIVGASSGQLFLKTGSTINLTCEISQSPEPPVFVFWYHNDRMINYDEAAKSHILVRKAGRNAAVSRLLVHDAVPSDSGNYTCGPSNADATSVAVFVLNGEKPAAIQHDSTPPSTARPSVCVSDVVVLLAVLVALRTVRAHR